MACAVYDFTLKSDDQNLCEIISSLKETCKKFVFQEEMSEGGYKHYQGRLSLIKKKTLSSLIDQFSNLPGFEFPRAHFSPTSKGVAKSNNFNYVMKSDTRIGRTYTDQDEVKVETKQMQIFNAMNLYPYQATLKRIASEFDLRTIDLIYDPIGNSGKSLFSEHMEYHGLAEEVPPYRMMDDIFQWVCTRPTAPCYIFDMPRGMKKDKLADFYSGIEVLKNGVAYDKRYSAKKVRFDRPRVFIFTNTLPEFDLMSKDRWKVWSINRNKELVPFDPFIE